MKLHLTIQKQVSKLAFHDNQTGFLNLKPLSSQLESLRTEGETNTREAVPNLAIHRKIKSTVDSRFAQKGIGKKSKPRIHKTLNRSQLYLAQHDSFVK